MTFRFPAVVLSLMALLGGLIYMLHLFGLVTAANEVYARFCALGLFAAGFLLLGWQKVKSHRFSWDDFYKNDTPVIVALSILLCSLFFKSKSFYCIHFFVVVSLIHLLCTRKFYAPPKFFYFIFAYALLLFLGTIGTEKGFRLPDKAINFIILPLSFCCFKLPKKTLLQIADFFLKTAILFLAVCILYWFYNFWHLEAHFIKWITGKTSYLAQMTGWEQVGAGTFIQNLDNALSKDTFVLYPAFLFVNSWAYFYHPTANAIVLLGGLTVSFYLYFQKDSNSSFSKWNLFLYIALCLFTLMLIESRIGIVGFFVISGISVLYYLKLKLSSKYFKIVLLLCVLFAGAGSVVFKDKISGFSSDPIRDSYRKIAVSYISENFYWGSAFDGQRVALEQQAEKIKDTLPPIVYPHIEEPIYFVHNQYLGNMVEFGIGGLIVLLAMLVAIGYYAIKNRNYALLAFLCFMLFMMWVDEGEDTIRLIFILFFTAFSEAEKNNTRILSLRK